MSAPVANLPRMASGNAEIDRILSGGFPLNSINIVMGPPGTGKTVFIQQLVFNNASGGRPILYLTALSEPLAKVARYLQRFEFFDAEKIGSEIIYQDIGEELASKGIEALYDILVAAIDEAAPKIIVIDSFKSLHDLSSSTAQTRKLLHEITGLLTAHDVTVFLVGEYTEEHVRSAPEFAIADSIVQLLRSDLNTRDERFLRVHKLRGSNYLEGTHAFRISARGLHVFPRLVSPPMPPLYVASTVREPTGIPGLDEAFGGGLWKGSTTLLVGPSGAGKTTCALQFALEGIRRGQPTAYLHFQENPTQLARPLTGLGFDPQSVEAQHLYLRYASPVELHIDSVIVSLFQLINEKKVQRIVIDAVGDLASAANDPRRLHDYLYALMQHFVVGGVTCVFVFESMPGELPGAAADGLHGRFSFMADSILSLRMHESDRIERTAVVVKSRGSASDPRVHQLLLGASGASLIPMTR